MQKKAVILHGTANDHTGNWFPWLKTELEKIGYEVWVPDLPDSEHPDAERYNDFLLASGWDFNNNLIVGHSSGAVEILALLSVLPKDAKINTAILIGSFAHPFDDDPNARRSGLFAKPFDYEYLKTKAKQFIFIQFRQRSLLPLRASSIFAQKISRGVRNDSGPEAL